MTAVVVLGASGMLGSMVVDVLARTPGLRLSATVREPEMLAAMRPRYPGVRFELFRFSADAEDELGVVDGNAWVVNAIGITKPLIRDDRPDEVERAIEVNARLPHLLGRRALGGGARVLQIATDCVYSGLRGEYTESDPHDALDVYGKTKSLGESWQPNVHHLRCSIIGPEPKDFKFLVEWFRRQPPGSAVNGFVNHRWNGVTTLHFAKLCRSVIVESLELPHLVHVVPTGTVTKAEMLRDFARVFDRPDLAIHDVEAQTVVDRTLRTLHSDVNRALWRAAGYQQPPTVGEMLAELSRHDFRALA